MKLLVLLLSVVTTTYKKDLKYCDIKGSVNNPGVYVVKDNYTIKDIIEEAGGLKKDSYTDNINLSKKVNDEMVIYINTKEEINKIKRLNNCDCSPKYVYTQCDNNVNNNIKETSTTIIKSNTTTFTTTIKPISTTVTTTKLTSKKTTTNNNIHNEPTKITTSQIQDNNIEDELIDINTCTLEDLIKLKG